MTAAPYGDKGCRCWRSEDYNPWDDRTHHEWMPNASCPHHGLLAGLARDRMETGAYRVVDLDLPSGRIVEHDDEPEAGRDPFEITPEETKAMREAEADPDAPRRRLSPRPGSPEWFAEERARRDAEWGLAPGDCAWCEPFACRVHCRPGQAADGSCLGPTTEKERGVLAAIRRFGRWLSSFTDCGDDGHC